MGNIKPIIMFGIELKKDVEYLEKIVGYVYSYSNFWKGYSYITKNSRGCFISEEDAKEWVINESHKESEGFDE